MAGLSLFAYVPGHTSLHRFDPRLKLAVILLLSIGIFLSGGLGLAILSCCLVVLIRISRYPMFSRNARKQLRGVLVLALIILAGRTFFSGGLESGILGAWRLLLFVLAGLILTVTTSDLQIRDSIASILKPVPFVPEQKLAFMLGLTITFIPIIFNISGEISEVHASRSIGASKNPVRRLVKYGGHVLTAVLKYTGGISDSMESRGYTHARSIPPYRIQGKDILATLVLIFFVAGAIAADRIFAPIWTL